MVDVKLVQAVMILGDEGGSILFYVSEKPIGKGDNYGPEELFPQRLEIDHLDNPPTFEIFETGESIELSSLIEQYSGWYCNVTSTWDVDGNSSL